MSDSKKPPSREEFERLREAFAAQAELIKEYLPDDPQKRKFLGEAAKGLGAVGALGIAGHSGYTVGQASAQASTSDSDVDIGSPNNRHDIFADGVDANTFGDVNANSVSAGSASIDAGGLDYGSHTVGAILEAQASGTREEHGTVSHADPGTASDGTWDTRAVDSTAVAFATAFAATPQLYSQAGDSDNYRGVSGYQNPSTTGFDSMWFNYRSDVSSGTNASWLAIGDE